MLKNSWMAWWLLYCWPKASLYPDLFGQCPVKLKSRIDLEGTRTKPNSSDGDCNIACAPLHKENGHVGSWPYHLLSTLSVTKYSLDINDSPTFPLRLLRTIYCRIRDRRYTRCHGPKCAVARYVDVYSSLFIADEKSSEKGESVNTRFIHSYFSLLFNREFQIIVSLAYA